MDSSRKSEVTRGVVIPLILLVVIFALGIVTDHHDVYVGMLAAVPMLAAVSAAPSLTAVVAVIAVLAGAALAAMPGDESFGDNLVPLVALAVLAVLAAVAVAASALRRAGVDQGPAPVERRKTAQFQLQTQADLDAMTGLLNRRGAIRALGTRNGEQARVVAFLDCDLFKSVNEQFGDDVGDEFLQAIAGRLRHRLPAHDTVARWDGDEFLLAITADESSARPTLERLVAGINGTSVRTTAGPISAAVSVGAAIWSPGQELENVISRSGRALYAAKKGGRGRIVLDGDGDLPAPPEGHSVREAVQLHDSSGFA